MANKTGLNGADCYGRSMVGVVLFAVNIDSDVLVNDWY